MNDKDNRTDRNKENIPAVPPGMWIKCTKCGKLIYRKELEKNKFICMKCGKYFRMPSENRILDIIDEGSFVELFTDVLDKNPIDFPGYSEKKEIIKKETNLKEAVITGKASIGHIEVMLGVCDTRYLMGSMGYIVGEKITKLFENATKAQLPVIMINCSGGARMQEGIYMCFEILRKVYKKENTKIKQCFEILICISLAVIEAINRSFRLYSILLIAVVIIVISITFSLIYKIKLRYTLLHTSLYCLSLELLDLFIIFTMGIVLHKEDLGIIIGRQNSISRILALFLGRALMFLISLAIVRYKELIDKNRIGSLVLILLSEIIGVIYFQSVYAGDSIPDLAKGYYMYFVIIILAIMFFAIYSIYRSALEESKIIKLRNRMLERNYEDLKVYYNDSRTLFHDYRAHITLLQKYLEENQIDKACLYLNSINKPLAELEKKIYTGNAVIDLVMNYKLSELKEKNIKIEYDIMPIDFGNYHFEESDIFVILYNLFDNAIEACENIYTREKWIYLSLRLINNMFMLCIQNSYEIEPKYENGELLTIKTDKHFHGIGMKSVKKIVEKYEGQLEYDNKQNIFEVSITLF